LPSEVRGAIGPALVLVVAYYLGVKIGFAFTLEPNAVSLMWPPNAIVLAALLLSPQRHWGWLAAAILPVHLVVQLSGGVPLSMSLCWYVSNLTEALLGAWIIRELVNRTPRFDRVRDASVFLLGGALVAPVISSFMDAAFVAWVGWRYEGDYWGVWRMRLFSNVLATITFVPLIVSVGTASVDSLRDTLRSRGLEAALLLALLALISWFVFHRQYAPGEYATFVYAPLPLIVWAAVRLGVGGVSSCIAVVALLSITGEMRGVGPFGRANPEEAVLSLQIFLIIAAGSFTLFAASLSELQDARSTALRRKESLDLALSAARMGVWEWDVLAERFTWRMASQDPVRRVTTSELLELVHPDDQALMSAAMHRVRQGEDVSEIECRFVRGENVRWIMGKGKYLRKGVRRPRRVIGVWMDITGSKHREVRERSQRAQLAHLSRVATLGELSGSLTHELSQPLSAILFNAQAGLRAMENDDPDMQEIVAILKDIVEADSHASEVIRRLRALFKRGTVQKERIDVRECIQAVLALEHSDLIVRSVATTVHLDADMPPVNVDPVQIQQVFLNLIVNACEAMTAIPVGRRALRITAFSEPETGTVHVAVCDSGPGIENPDKIFEPFFTTKTHGIGLGLTISRTIVGAHGGRLWATNNPSCGATLHVSVPVEA
jgi:two-component system sensor kinase FixL